MRRVIARLTRCCVSAGVLCGLLASGAAGQQFIRLRPSFIPGEEAVYRRDLQLRQVMRRPTVFQGNTLLLDMTAGYRLRVLEDQRTDHHPLELTFLVLAHRMSPPVGLQYDSRIDRDSDDVQARVVGALLDRPFQIVVREDGSVSQVSGLEGFVSDDFGVEPGEPALAVVNHYHSLVSAASLEQLLLYNLLRDAPEEILVGGTWPSRFEVPQAGGAGVMVRDLGFVLKEVKLENFRPVAHLSLKGEISLGRPAETQPSVVEINLMTGTEEGSMAVDVARRDYRRVELTQNVRQDVRVRAGSEPMGVRRAIEQVTRVVLERTDLAELMRPPPRLPPLREMPPETQPAATEAGGESPP